MQSERMVMSQDNISILQETLEVLNKGFYKINGKTISLKLTRSQMEEAKVFFPRDVAAVRKNLKHVHKFGRCFYACENMDSFSLARKRISLLSDVDMQNGQRRERILSALREEPGLTKSGISARIGESIGQQLSWMKKKGLIRNEGQRWVLA